MRARLAVVAGLTTLATALTGCATGSSTAPGTGAAGGATTATAGTAAGSGAASTSASESGSTTAPTTGSTTGSTIGSTAGPTWSVGTSVPVWPFTTLAEVRTWQDASRSGGHQPWHLDAGQTALAFATGYLGYPDVDRVTTTRVTGGDAHIGVGWNDPETAQHTVAVLHLVRWGTGTDAPWVVVGSDDTDLTLSTPRYGSAVTSPLAVGGVISGVDESLRVIVLRSTSTTPLAVVAGLPAGGVRTPWSTTVRFTAPSGTVLTVAVSTGGHLKSVERFAVTAVRVR